VNAQPSDPSSEEIREIIELLREILHQRIAIGEGGNTTPAISNAFSGEAAGAVFQIGVLHGDLNVHTGQVLPSEQPGETTDALAPRRPHDLVLPFYLVCDESHSMVGSPIEALNSQLSELHMMISSNSFLSDKIRFCLIGYSDDARVLLPLSDLCSVQVVPKLTPGGGTNYTAFFDLLRNTINDDGNSLQELGYQVYKPAVFLLIGSPPGDATKWPEAHRRLTSPHWKARPNIIAFGFGSAAPADIRQIATAPNFNDYGTLGPTEALAKYASFLTRSIVSSDTSKPPPGYLAIPDGVI
jgi:uncharacterized protein YegL